MIGPSNVKAMREKCSSVQLVFKLVNPQKGSTTSKQPAAQTFNDNKKKLKLTSCHLCEKIPNSHEKKVKTENDEHLFRFLRAATSS